jgi:hypothetical protein
MNSEMLFETTIRLFFGNQAYQIAGQGSTPKYQRDWVRKVLKKLMRDIDKLDTTVGHKARLMKTADAAYRAVGRNDRPTWVLVYRLLAFVGRLLGYDFLEGSRLHSISYWQTPGQYYQADILSDDDALQGGYDKNDAIGLRSQVAKELSEKGLSDFKITLVLNTSEYEIANLIFPRDTGHQVKDHIMIRNEVIDEKATVCQ